MLKNKKKKCPFCKSINEVRRKFCENCGRPIQNEPEDFYKAEENDIKFIHSKKKQADWDGHF